MSAGSGHMKDDEEAAIDSGADAFLMKPFDLVDLLDEINGLLAKAKPGAGRRVQRSGKNWPELKPKTTTIIIGQLGTEASRVERC